MKLYRSIKGTALYKFISMAKKPMVFLTKEGEWYESYFTWSKEELDGPCFKKISMKDAKKQFPLAFK